MFGALILSATQHRFPITVIHLTGTQLGWRLEGAGITTAIGKSLGRGHVSAAGLNR